MGTAFLIAPKLYETFENEAAQIDKCKEWGLLSEKASKTKAFFYKGYGLNVPCSLIGYVDQMTAVIELEPNQFHCIHPSLLKEMQATNYSQRLLAAAEEAIEINEMDPSETPIAVAAIAELPVIEPAKLDESPVAAKQEETTTITTASASASDKPKKSRIPKLELPEEKVKMRATVKEFVTVPNHFSDNDDEVIIYEAASFVDTDTEIGEVWSSHSATLKKLELAVGDILTFEGKIVAKKLTKHPVPYKINNPAKIQKG